VLNFLVQAISLSSSVGAIYLCSTKAKNKFLTEGRRRLGCLIGAFIATPVNLHLTYDGPFSVFALTMICGAIYLHGIGLPELWNKVWKRS